MNLPKIPLLKIMSVDKKLKALLAENGIVDEQKQQEIIIYFINILAGR